MRSLLSRLEETVLHRQPLRVALWRRLMRAFPVASFPYWASIDAVARPQNAHCILQAARLAKNMELEAFSIIEFGVAGGNGLVNIESHVKEVEKASGIKCQVYGFDTGASMPPSRDHRDLLYAWAEGFYEMDRETLEQRLEFSTLVIGDAKDTCRDFFEQYRSAPIGCILFDLDYYTSTIDAFQIFEADPETRLPRVECHFDDISHTNEFLGELCAIKEFNDNHEMMKIAPPHMFKELRPVPMKWNDEIFTFHYFSHPKYNVCHRGERQMPLTP